MKFGIVVFPGSNCDADCHHVVTHVLGCEAVALWHKETSLQGCDCVILPGGYSHADYLRCGAMAAFSPIMTAVKGHAAAGGLVFGICNGFQILTEAGLLPGVLMRNTSIRHICRDVTLRVNSNQTRFTRLFRAGEVLTMPIAHNEGNYFVERRQLVKLEEQGQILLRYCAPDGELTEDANPNGSLVAIAGIVNEQGNVCGMMPHPERCSEAIFGNRDGKKMFESML
ncbi:MAG: phosphoribosylformylglycinamidine synthase subunit PurQ [Deltaproteobacteria bacterium]|nr:phosphoribosylformylglycinamidine synthase subunit PurQ [Deltaproteobacteria bacterium]